MPHNILREIESTYKLKDLKFLDSRIWPYLRVKFAENYRSQKLGYKSRIQKMNLSSFWILLRNCSYGIFYLRYLKHVNYLFFSSSERRKALDGKYHERVLEGAMHSLPDSLLVENPFPLGKHYKKKDIPTNKVISESLFLLGTLLFYFLNKGKFYINEESILLEIHKSYHIDFNYKTALKRFLGQYYLMKFLLKLFHPKAVYFAFPGSSMGYIKAFKEEGIPIIEIQHGIINDKHIGYNVYSDFGKELYPDYLLVYGNKELEIFTPNNFFIDRKHVLPIGYYFLEKTEMSKIPPNLINKYVGLFDKLIAFSFQHPFAKKTIEFLSEAARLDCSIGYLIVPRSENDKFLEYDLPENIMIAYDLNIYQAIRIADFHSTINSTCAIESLWLGKPNILLNIDNLAKEYYGNLFQNTHGVFYVNRSTELVRLLQSDLGLSKKKITEQGSFFIKSNFNDNFKEFVSTVLSHY